MLFNDSEKEMYKKMFEAALIYEGKPVNIEELSEIFGITPEFALEIMNDLKKDYIFRDSGFIIHNRDMNYYFVINPKIKEKFQEHFKLRNNNEIKLTPSLKEALSIIAYKQPITKIEIDEIRGYDSSYSIRRLMETDLIKITGKKQIPGKPSLYGTTDLFLKSFGLSSLEQLPDLDDISLGSPFFGEDEEEK